MTKLLSPILALLIGAAILLAGNGLQSVLVPIRASLENFSLEAIGLLASAYSLGYIFSCYLTPHMVRRVGHIRSFAVLASVASAVILSMSLAVHPIIWITLRIITGFCLAGLFMVIESWLNEKSTNDNRGRVFSVYMIVNLSAVTFGQMLLPTAEPLAFTLFIITGIAITLALVPVSLTTSTAPRPIAEVKLRIKRLYRMSPVGVLGCFFVGMANGSYAGLGAVFAQRLGLSITGIALFMSASLIGGALAQMPVGRLSDRMDRRKVIIGVCIGGAGLGLALALLGSIGGGSTGVVLQAVIIAATGVFGCFIYTMYALCVAHTNDFIPSQDFVEASSGLLLTYGIGAIIGPLLASILMQHFGNGALFAFTAVIHLSFGGFALYRMKRRSVPTERENYVQVAASRSTPAAIMMDPRAQEAEQRSPD